MFNDKKTAIQAIPLVLASVFMSAGAMAEERDISQQKGVADFGIPKYTINEHEKKVTIPLNAGQLLSLNSVLYNTNVSNIVFFSKKLDKPNKKKCAFIGLKNEKLSINYGLVTTVKITNIKPEDLELAPASNCTVVGKQALLKAAGLSTQQPPQPDNDYDYDY